MRLEWGSGLPGREVASPFKKGGSRGISGQSRDMNSRSTYQNIIATDANSCIAAPT